MKYGYCRISRKEQSIECQKRNIKKDYPKLSLGLYGLFFLK